MIPSFVVLALAVAFLIWQVIEYRRIQGWSWQAEARRYAADYPSRIRMRSLAGVSSASAVSSYNYTQIMKRDIEHELFYGVRSGSCRPS